ncbi:MAG TPA: Gfo/Idh/MocA family oxidoreductase, partial [Phyllobacterium sp.]|nr:Gfo/Idh/MocA family oxidoreductase [Phyllobacterium sp.]
MKIAIIGTGFVADYYMTTLVNHPQLVLGGVYDRDPARLKQFADYYKVAAYSDFDAILADKDVGIVVNLTTPENHYSLSKRALEAGKHVYCEKPLAMRYEEAAELVALADRLGL